MKQRQKENLRLTIEAAILVFAMAIGIGLLYHYFAQPDPSAYIQTQGPITLEEPLDQEAVSLMSEYLTAPEKASPEVRQLYEDLFQEMTSPSPDTQRLQALKTTIQMLQAATSRQEAIPSDSMTTTVTQTTTEAE